MREMSIPCMWGWWWNVVSSTAQGISNTQKIPLPQFCLENINKILNKILQIPLIEQIEWVRPKIFIKSILKLVCYHSRKRLPIMQRSDRSRAQKRQRYTSWYTTAALDIPRPRSELCLYTILLYRHWYSLFSIWNSLSYFLRVPIIGFFTKLMPSIW